MKRPQIYLDYNATAPLHDEVKAAITTALEEFGNPSSVHGRGRAARGQLEQARESLAQFIGAKPAQIIFTSGGTEANCVALVGIPPEKSLVSAIEHPSVAIHANLAQHIPVDSEGVIKLDILEQRLRDENITLVSVMMANNETGVIQPIEKIAKVTKAHGARLHVDAVQALGKLPLDFAHSGIDMMSLSAHKIGGPKGVGALVVANDIVLKPLIRGGGQELGRRGGTENLLGIIGFGAAVEAVKALGPWTARIEKLRDEMENTLRQIAPDAVIWSKDVDRLATTSAVAMPGVSAQTLLMALDLAGICVSAGSACSSGKVSESPVLSAMGASPELARSTIRVSLGWGTSAQDIDGFIDAWRGHVTHIRKAKV